MGLEQQEIEMSGVSAPTSRQRGLWEVEKYFREQGVSEFTYDEPLDVLRFPEDGNFALCREFADSGKAARAWVPSLLRCS